MAHAHAGAGISAWVRRSAILGPFGLPVLIHAFGINGALWLPVVLAALGIANAGILGVETKGKTLEELAEG